MDMASSDSMLLAICRDSKSTLSFATVQLLIAAGENVNARKDDKYGFTVLHYAVANAHLNAVKALLTAEGIDLDAKDNFQATAFLYACFGGHVEIIKAFLEAYKKTSNFDINDTFIDGQTALMGACVHNRVEATKFLLSIPHINAHQESDYGNTALFFAKGKPNEDEIRALFQGELLPLQLLITSTHYTHTPLFSLAHTIFLPDGILSLTSHAFSFISFFSQLLITERRDSWCCGAWIASIRSTERRSFATEIMMLSKVNILLTNATWRIMECIL
jgi:hypothetical protein